ncbi:hypothetical protein EJD97_002550 [Solanum chilense]|uniref:Glutathione S-transferase n=1 Tax=Solanum chilense TaxID=4083 RepID=A0A6N2C436_SOLCI|nr:hypothetical protein EJD97_002550 [Solanum chilense]
MIIFKVNGWTCTPPLQLTLKIKSIEYEFIQEHMLNKSELLLKSNPFYKKIPILFHDEKPICESLVILQYIDEPWLNGPSILPSDPYNRSIARFWAAYIQDKLKSLVAEYRYAEGKEAKAVVVDKMSEGNMLMEETFIKISKGKSLFSGDSIGYVDIVLGSLLGWVR